MNNGGARDRNLINNGGARITKEPEPESDELRRAESEQWRQYCEYVRNREQRMGMDAYTQKIMAERANGMQQKMMMAERAERYVGQQERVLLA